MGGLDQLARSLPAQPLGLNLSFQGFGGSVDGAKVCDEDLFGVPSIRFRSSSPAASSYSPPATGMASGTHGSPAALSAAEKYDPPPVDAPAAFIAPVLDDMETQSTGEMQQGVAWWGEAASKILLESMEGGGGEVAAGCVADVVATADAEAAGLPAEWRWLCEAGVGAVTGGADDKPPDVLETMHADGGGDGIALPCLDDIEGWDGEWFSCSS
ncbi:hypothetical protein PVAP13_2KG553700 [Panicum virgatum]|uniref:Uncharacterized protein n=1 Tax=Panicum virgatum TaxID=38727 RepID=A0A8T0WUA0_PANVG|nr:hypothetical protein PVAP13_2KG553700 [Panicum virgatum]